MARYIFSAGSARGGTGLLTRMLSVSPVVEIALDPYLELYKSFRSAVVRDFGAEEIKKAYNPNTPIDDYYFRDDRISLLDIIMAAPLDILFDASERKSLIDSLKARASLSSGDLVPVLDELKGRTYKELFESGLSLICRSRKRDSLEWVGIHENWTVEFLVPLARAFSHAKFFIIVRDPRAVIASNIKAANEKDRGQILSYCRCLRKMMACARHFESMDLFRDRLLVVRYEDLVVRAEQECRKLCDFLRIEYSDDMLDTNKYVEPSSGQVYNGFSSYEPTAVGISPNRIYRWRQYLNDDSIALIDFLCGPEMALFDYKLGKDDGRILSQERIFETLKQDLARKVSWRTDLGSLEQDYALELSRRELLKNADVGVDEAMIRRSFLFRDVFDMIVKKGKVLNEQ